MSDHDNYLMYLGDMFLQRTWVEEYGLDSLEGVDWSHLYDLMSYETFCDLRNGEKK